MANVMRHRYGAKNPVLAEPASSTVIEVGDLCTLSSNQVKNFNGTASTTTATTLTDIFLGVAMQASANGETTPIRIATSGTFEYPLAAQASVYLGYGVAPTPSGANWADQEVVMTTGGVSASCFGYAQPSNTGGVGGSIENCLVTINANVLGGKIDA